MKKKTLKGTLSTEVAFVADLLLFFCIALEVIDFKAIWLGVNISTIAVTIGIE